MYRSLTVLALLTAAGLASGCGDDDLPTAPTEQVQTSESFSNTLNPFSARNHDFTALSPGPVQVQLVALNPNDTDNPTTIGVAVGTWTGNACQVVVDRNSVGLNGIVSATATGSGSLCARVYDSSDTGLTTPVEYTIVVLH